MCHMRCVLVGAQETIIRWPASVPPNEKGHFWGEYILWHPSMHAKDIRRIYDTVKPPEVDTAYVDNPLKLISFVRSLLDAM